MDNNTPEPIATIGSSCRFPGGCNSPSQLWELLKNPVDLVKEIPESRFNPAGFYHENPERPGTSNVTKAYLLDDDPFAFDNDFFNISAREAASMDPQQRIILEIIYECIESAGYSISQLKGSSTGVFVGQMGDDYRDLLLRDLDSHPQHTGTGITRSILANRVSYFFDWKGPSVNIDTACSSSLVALHLAVQSLRSGESEMAVVAGTNLVLGPELFSILSSLRMLSPNGRCRMWDISADGYARGEGFAALVIKPLKNAFADGDDVESIIRNTGVNQDGRSSGLTVPSATSQAELIRSTYARCGLDCLKKDDRCQYFEAHGTGTQAGDPKEAEGISSTFFPNHNQENGVANGTQNQALYVGSIKTVIGHTEGTAGLASLLKASLAVQHGLIPPNLHFDELNPAIEPYYHHLQVPKRLTEWPELPAGTPRRASVNSFGFGGTNAHAIVESWENQATMKRSDSPSPCWGPFVLSANSEKALVDTVTSLSTALNKQNMDDLSRLAWTLQTRRTNFKYRTSFSATSKEELIASIDSAMEQKDQSSIATKAKGVTNISILGVFTGQGAQWPSMGASLFRHSETFRRSIIELDAVIKDVSDAPAWSLTEELMRQGKPDRILSAEISQPLCTALQMALVDLLKECGVNFSAVVGHSSGEVAAAYAAGILSARDAILIAFYRGYHTRNDEPGTKLGKMMAVGMEPKDAEDFCRQDRFLGRISVAAKNSNSSVTLSGDADGIDEAKEILDKKGVFSKILFVDNAYHSHHMERVRKPYFASLKAANIQPRRKCFGGSCNFYSSVYGPTDGKNMTTPISFEHTYWVDNMTNPVLFANALTPALQTEHFDAALEIGPHPALRAPATECIRDIIGSNIPYQGVLERNKDALNTFYSALGFLWRNFDCSNPPIDFAGFRRACDGSDWTMPRVHKGLPNYPWDHDRSMLKESKRSKARRTRNSPVHELLGSPIPGTKHGEVHWRNILKLGDVEWLQGHQFQGQVLLPAASYLSMAVKATLHLIGNDHQVQMVELQDVVIHNAITLEEGSPGIDINFVIRLVGETAETKTAEFYCYCSNADAGSPEFEKDVFSGRALVKLGPPVEDILPGRVAPSLPMKHVPIERFYAWMQKLGLQYANPFLLESITRRLNVATVTTMRPVTHQYMIHPGTLDGVIQSLYAAFSYPGDGRIWTPYLPNSFQSIRFDMNTCRQRNVCESRRMVADCYITESSAEMIRGDIDVFCAKDGHAEIQAQGVVFYSLEIPTAANDRSMFWHTVWKRDVLSVTELDGETGMQAPFHGDFKLHEICDRTAYFYLNALCKEIGVQEIESMDSHFQSLMHWALDHVPAAAKSGHHPRWKAGWEMDTIETIMGLNEDKYHDLIDLKLIHSIGSKLPSIVRGLEPALQVLKEDDMLDRLYTEGLGLPETNDRLGTLIDHLVHRYPRMRVLEIGAGTGASTSTALKHLGSNLEDYTFTDLSPAFFQAAKSRFADHEAVMSFQVLNIEQPPIEQGFQEHSYDLVIAAHVLHATRSISQTVKHCRELLRPGGYLIILELTNITTLRTPFEFCSLPGWWLGREDGRTEGPNLTEAQWHGVLSENFFSEVDLCLRDFADDSMHTFSAMVSQAVDDRVGMLRNPLNLANGLIRIEKLLIIGGHTLTMSKLAKKVKLLLTPFAKDITIIDSLEAVPGGALQYGSVAICLSGLEEATFAGMTEQRISAMQKLFRESRYILWATRGCRADDPYANIAVGIGRSACREMADLRLKLVDVEYDNPQPDPSMFVEMLLQMICLDLPAYDDILWSNETEVAVEDGTVLIPRVVPDENLNNSFNSARRRITRNVCPTSTPIEISNTEEGIIVKEIGVDRKKVPTANRFQVLSSSLFRFACADDNEPSYICQALSLDTQQHVLAISATNGSEINVPADCTFDYKSGGSPNDLLSSILTVILCESILSGSTGTVWIHDVDDRTAEIIHIVAGNRNVSFFLTTSDSTSALISSGKATYIHPRASERQLRSLIPHNIRRFVNMGVNADTFEEFVTSFPGQEIDIQQVIHNVNMKRTISLSYNTSSLLKILQNYCSRPDLLEELTKMVQTTTVKANQVQEQPETATATSIISWTGIQSIPVQVTPASHGSLFADQKTYFMIGLAGDVGLSLCDWMADHGAKYFAIASRNPTVPPQVLANFGRKGVTVRLFSLDVSNMENLRNVHQEIHSCMPPIAGVANGALVVRDHPFDSISFEDLETVFKPKVIGSQNLDRLFSSTASQLDFFILFSSVAGIVGKPAQSSYNAANLFMSTLAMQRRKRGLTASVIHFGMLLGLGFLVGKDEQIFEDRFRRDDVSAIPEPEFHEVFAQAILSGSPESGLNPEIIAGLGTELDTPWRAMPRFWHCRVKGEEGLIEGRNRDQGEPTQSIQDNLKGASDNEKAFSILKSAIRNRVGIALGSSADSLDENVGLIKLGFDSLVAVDIRSWLRKVLEVDVPVLKFLSGSTLQDLCHCVLAKLPKLLRPWAEEKDDHKESNDEISPIPAARDSKVVPKSNDIEKSAISPSEHLNGTVVLNGTPHIPLKNALPENKVEQPGKIEYERIGEMSHAQAQLYFLHDYLQNNAYNVAYCGLFHGQLDITRLKDALQMVGMRHQSMRTAYFVEMSSSKAVQAVLAEPHIILEHKTISDDVQVQKEMDRVKDFRFELEKGVVMKVTVLSHSASLHSILFNHHHIALDGISWSIFISDLAQTYSGHLSGKAVPEVLQSIDMAKRQLKTYTPKNLHEDFTFWKSMYRIVPEPLPLFPFAKVKNRPAVADYNINTADARLDNDLSKLIEKAASKIGVTSFQFYLASFATFLARCLDVNDIAIGVVDAKRTEEDEMGTTGYFLNMLPLRIQLEHSEQFEAVTRSTRDVASAALDHSHAPFDMVLDDLGVSRSTNHHPLFQVAINYRKAPLNETDFGHDGKIQWDGAVPGGHPYDILLNIATTPDWTLVSFITQRNLYEPSDGELLLKWYTRSLEALARDTCCEVWRCPIANETDIAEVIELGRGPDTVVPWSGTLTDRIDEVAVQLPEAIAIRDDQGQTLTYAQMTARMILVSRQLQEIEPPLTRGSHVAMLLDPVSDAMCCILAILRLGLVWIPLDTRNHHQRLRTVVEESRPRVLVYHDATKEMAHQITANLDLTAMLNLDNNRHSDNKSESIIIVTQDTIKEDTQRYDQPAMILYTSGSTGVPKGVVLTHGGLVNQIYGTTATIKLGRETTLQQSPLGFDLMLDQIFLALCNGGTIVIVGKSGRGDPMHIADLMVKHDVTLTHFVPSEYLALLNYGHHILRKSHSWRYAMSGGEKLGWEVRKAFHRLDCDSLNLVNVYGPAEITLACARGIVPYRELNYKHDQKRDFLRPSPNYSLKIIDSDRKILPVGFPGEICISGQGIGLGYLGRSEESALKFISRKPMPSSSTSTRVYRSGDKGRILPDGTLEVLGRLYGDSQVKIHGFRVELEEISNAMVHVSKGAIVNSAASWRPGQPSGVLVAFVVFDISFTGDKTDFIEKMRADLPLPGIMKPAFIVPIGRIPATTNGKTDRHAIDKLPIPQTGVSDTTDGPARNLSHWELSIKEIWEEVLSTRIVHASGRKWPIIQPGADFFQVGGTSILMIKLKSLIAVQFGVTLSMPELFKSSTLSSMATLISNATDTAKDAATPTSFLGQRITQSTVNWDLEIASLADGLPPPRPNPLRSGKKLVNGNAGLGVVLTGATGFIGRHLLLHLVQDSRVGQVHCLAIRPDESGNPRHVSIDSDKIIEYAGDLSTLNLGLLDSEFDFLTEHADIIIHNGADVSLLKTYQSLRRSNVVSTRSLCEMAIPRRVPLYYVSTASVAKAVNENGEEPLLEVPASPPDFNLLNSIDGYAATKWMSEALLEKATVESGLPTYIHRLAHVVGDDASELDAAGMLNKYSLMLRAYPRIDPENVSGQWDFVTVENVVADLVQSAIESTINETTQQGKQALRPVFINHCNDVKISHDELRAYLEGVAGESLREMDMKEWLAAASERGLHPLVYEFLAAFDQGGGKMVLPVIAKGI